MNDRDLTTPFLTELEFWLLDTYVPGFHRDVHNITLNILCCFDWNSFGELLSLPAPVELENYWKCMDNYYEGTAMYCYQQFVLLSMKVLCILDARTRLSKCVPAFGK